MSIAPKYFEYLKHFRKTVTVQQLAQDRSSSNLIALRHDVDYDLDLALEMSYWEHEWGICSSYYLLHTADYWQDNRFYEKCLQIQEFGHEIGLHLNVLTEWMEGKIDDVGLRLKNLLQELREAGVIISGISPHGDRCCYEKAFINYWGFAELLPDNPQSEWGLSAEGIRVDEKPFQIQYPTTHELIREDGERFPLWSLSMQELGLHYEAMHVPYDAYYTDSGGNWSRSRDPLTARSLQKGRHQILIHPIYWRGTPKTYFFLSTARSGSTWLANILNEATPLVAKHEFTLNHRYQNDQLVAEKNTGHGFTDLINSSQKVNHLLREARSWREELPNDYGEANVYLSHFPNLLKAIFPDAILIHLSRHPQKVVPSLLNRNWYDTPKDNQHPPMSVVGWEQMGQFEKVCWYIRQTNESLLRECQKHLMLENLVSDFNVLASELRKLEIPFFPRLAQTEFSKRLNANVHHGFPPYPHWSLEQKVLFHHICDPIAIALGYRGENKFPKNLADTLRALSIRLIQFKRRVLDFKQRILKTSSERLIYEIDFTQEQSTEGLYLGCQVKPSSEGLQLIPDGERNAHFLLSRGKWYSLAEGEGFPLEVNCYYQGLINFTISEEGSVRLFCLMYDWQGQLMDKRSLGVIHANNGEKQGYEFSFRLQPHIDRFNMALYLSVANLPKWVNLKQFKLLEVNNH